MIVHLFSIISIFLKLSVTAIPDPDLEAFMSVPQLCLKYGYPIETHRIQTSDGYLLTAHRIPYSIKSPINKDKNKRVVYLGHGLTASSAVWVTNDADKNWAYLLADAGYDVWMVNNRGNLYSRNHITLSSSESKFWNFTLTEIGAKDFPAAVDYILKQTNVPDLYYIGHSMGTTALLIGTSMYPEYNSKIRLSVLLAPTIFCTNMKSPLRYLTPLEGLATNLLQGLSYKVPLGELSPNNYILALLKSYGCNVDIVYTAICQNWYFLLFGFDVNQLSRERLPVYLGHTPDGTSIYNALHYGQLANNGRFCEYDYGFKSATVPRDFDLSKVTHKTVLYYGDNDWLADMKDVGRLYHELKNVVGYFQVNYLGFTHIDFIWGNQIVPLIIEPVIEFMSNY